MRLQLMVAFSAVSAFCFSQQKMTLQEGENAFNTNNLQLVAQKYNVSMAEADIVQAKIWDQPTLNYGAAIHTPQNRRWFDVPHTSTVGVQQLFLLGGKRKKQNDYLTATRDVDKLQFTQMLFDLTAQLRENFYSLYFEEQKVARLDVEIDYLTDLIKAYKTQNKLGNISLKDVVSIQNMLMNLYSTKQQLNANIQNYKQNLKVLTGTDADIEPAMTPAEEKEFLMRRPEYTLDEMKQKALENNANYLAAQKQITSSQYNLVYQKSLNIPDLTAGVNFSQMGNYSFNESDFGLSIPLPLWSKNKGNIQHAAYALEQSKANEGLQKITLLTQTEQNYNTWKLNFDQYHTFSDQDYSNMDLIFKGMMTNFRLRNVSLTDFTIFMDSYNTNMLQLLEVKKQIMISAEEVNHITESKIFNP